MMLFLDQHLDDTHIYVEKEVVDSMNNLVEKKAFIKEGLNETLSDKVTVIFSQEDRQKALENPHGIYITGVDMLTTDTALEYYNVLKKSPFNQIIISSHAATGTVGTGVLNKEYCEKNQVLSQSQKIIFKVHLDDDDIFVLCTHTQPKSIILFHADEIHNKDIIERLSKDNKQAMSIMYPNKVIV